MANEHFIPLTKASLVELLSQQLEPAEQDRFGDFCRMLEATLHYEYHAQLEHLCQAYQACNPDSDKLPGAGADSDPAEFFPRLRHLAERAN